MENKITKETEQMEPPSAEEVTPAAGQDASELALARISDTQASTKEAKAEHIEPVAGQGNEDDMENREGDEEKTKQKSVPRAKRKNNRWKYLLFPYFFLSSKILFSHDSAMYHIFNGYTYFKQ